MFTPECTFSPTSAASVDRDYGCCRTPAERRRRALADLPARRLVGLPTAPVLLCPGYTYTGFHDTEEYKDFDRSEIPKWLWMSADDVVAASLKALDRKRFLCIPGTKYRLLSIVFRSRLLRPILRAMANRS